MHDEYDEHDAQVMDALEARLDAAAGVRQHSSPIPDSIAARVRYGGRVRRVRLVAIVMIPIALAVGLMSILPGGPGDPAPAVGDRDILASFFPEGDYRGLIGGKELEGLLSDSRPLAVVRASSEHVYSFRDGHDPAMIESLFSGS